MDKLIQEYTLIKDKESFVLKPGTSPAGRIFSEGKRADMIKLNIQGTFNRLQLIKLQLDLRLLADAIVLNDDIELF